MFLPIFNKWNYKFEKKNPFFLPESRSRDPQVACPKKHFFDDGLGYKSLVNEWFIEWLLLLCQEWLLRLLFPRMHLFSPGCSLLKWRTSTKCFHIGRVIQYAFTYIYIGVLGMKILIYLILNKLVRSCLLMSLRWHGDTLWYIFTDKYVMLTCIFNFWK